MDIPEKPREAALFLLARGDWVAKVNGHVVGAKERWNSFDRQDIAQELVPGKNLIEVSITVRPPERFERDAGVKTKKAALAGLLKITRADGSLQRFATNGDWQARLAAESAWQAANVVGDLN